MINYLGVKVSLKAYKIVLAKRGHAPPFMITFIVQHVSVRSNLRDFYRAC